MSAECSEFSASEDTLSTCISQLVSHLIRLADRQGVGERSLRISVNRHAKCHLLSTWALMTHIGKHEGGSLCTTTGTLSLNHRVCPSSGPVREGTMDVTRAHNVAFC